MRDEIMRLAERAAEMLDMFEQALVQYAPISDIERWPYHPEITDTAEQLRALARTDHVEDKLGMVADGWQLVPLMMTLEMDVAFCEAWFSRRRPIDDSETQDAWEAALAAAPAPDHSAGNCIAAMSRMKDAAMVAHKLCYEAMLKHPDVETLGDDGELHKAIHAIVGVDTPNYVASPDRSADVRVSLHRKARELLAAEYARDGQAFVADRIRTDAMLTHVEDRSLRAIVAALAQPADADSEGAK